MRGQSQLQFRGLVGHIEQNSKPRSDFVAGEWEFAAKERRSSEKRVIGRDLDGWRSGAPG